MSLTESIVEDAALEWFLLRQGYGGQVGEQCRVAPPLIPAFSQGEKEKDGKVGLVGHLRGAIRRSAGAGLDVPQSCNLAALRGTLLPKLLSGDENVAPAENKNKKDRL